MEKTRVGYSARLKSECLLWCGKFFKKMNNQWQLLLPVAERRGVLPKCLKNWAVSWSSGPRTHLRGDPMGLGVVRGEETEQCNC